jgi:hypothetical protein
MQPGRWLPSSVFPTDGLTQCLSHLWHHYGARHLRSKHHPRGEDREHQGLSPVPIAQESGVKRQRGLMSKHNAMSASGPIRTEDRTRCRKGRATPTRLPTRTRRAFTEGNRADSPMHKGLLWLSPSSSCLFGWTDRLSRSSLGLCKAFDPAHTLRALFAHSMRNALATHVRFRLLVPVLPTHRLIWSLPTP